MEEQTKKMIILVVAALVVVLVVFGVIFYFRSSTSEVVEDVQQPTQPVVQETPLPENKTTNESPAEPVIQQIPPADSKDAQLKRFSIDFVARFGTYSSDAQSENLKQLLPSMSGTLKTWAQGIIANTVSAGSEKFSGVTTKALSAKIISQGGGSAIVEVSTQRTFTEGNEKRVTYETATVSLTNSGSWLVDSVKWALRSE